MLYTALSGMSRLPCVFLIILSKYANILYLQEKCVGVFFSPMFVTDMKVPNGPNDTKPGFMVPRAW